MRRIFVAGHKGMVGSAICRFLKQNKDVYLITRTRDELDLCDQAAVYQFIRSEKPCELIIAAAKVGGIYANNTYPAQFIHENLLIQANLIHAAHLNDVQKILFLGSSCIYPRKVSQPMSESALLTGALEPTNEPYAIAKIAGIKMCESYNRQYGRDYRSVMPTNLYGPGDNYHPDNSHVVPALINRLHRAKVENMPQVVVWGTGTAMREFLYVDDMAKASLHVHNLDKDMWEKHTQAMCSHINVGTGVDVSIKDLAETIKKIVGFKGRLVFDKTKPDGSPRKLLDVSKISKLGWSPTTDLVNGLVATYENFLSNNIKNNDERTA